MFQNVYLIFNPVSGQGDAEAELALIRQEIEAKVPLKILETSPEETAADLTQRAIAHSADCVIASGGDGTVSAVAGAMVESDIPLGIIPRGTANAIASAFGISNDLQDACHVVLSGVSRNVDIANCDGRPLMLLAGIGLEADVIEQANRPLKNKIGTVAYILSAFKQVQDLSTFEVELETSDRIITVEAAGITVANAAPATSVLAQGPANVLPYDGLLDVTIFAPQGTSSAIAASYNLFQSALSDRSIRRSDVGYFRCTSVKVTATPTQKVVVDGEVIGSTPINIRCIPRGLILMTPEKSGADPSEDLEGLPNLKIQYKQR